MSATKDFPRPGRRTNVTDRASMVRVDQAGEFGAVRIYAGQLAVLRDGAARQHAWLMATPGQVPQVVRDRVASVVVAELTRTFDVHGAVRFIARRSGDAVAWLTLPDDAEWAATPQGTASIAAELADIRSAMGV